ncbi:MAG: ABC transporter substrate-binding protein, partial [Pseudorhodoplanes sp.]|nr:ABC transporter substrate-binding protein [Pseudorhodoplanes sp.]
YQLTANVWARAILQDDYGVKPANVVWVRGGIEAPGRPEKIKLSLPPDVKVENAPDGTTISGLLADGAIDGFIAPRPPSFIEGHPNIGWLFPDPVAAAKDYYRRTRIFPIMHLVGVRRDLADRHPWLPAAVMKAFEQAKAAALAHLEDTAATKVTLPFVEEQIKAARDLMGHDSRSYGVAPNRHVLESFLKHHQAQGLSARPLAVEELFHPATLESFKI